jgi:hypothetical protein
MSIPFPEGAHKIKGADCVFSTKYLISISEQCYRVYRIERTWFSSYALIFP